MLVGIQEAAELFRHGEVVAFPTETVYGLGADATNSSAVKKIYSLKGRPSENPLIVHVANPSNIEKWAVFSPKSRVREQLHRLESLWPGPLTVVLPNCQGFCREVTAGRPSAGFRIPDHEIALQLLEQTGVPIAAPSANKSNYVSATSVQHVIDCFGLDLPILDGGCSPIGIESTIVALHEDRAPELLRPGFVGVAEIQAALGDEVVVRENIRLHGETPDSPGQYKRHYSPRTPIKLFQKSTQNWGDLPGRVGVITFSLGVTFAHFPSSVSVVHETLSHCGDIHEAGKNLYTVLRK
ncbi:MAG: threonylcarbamoyl-AMP synthase, partial [Bdellovibrionales bacterium]|nr:threonylcarbamoyl-AMP synthase [Bdellovibrionales bacterium]